jgi:hypothetical protein
VARPINETLYKLAETAWAERNGAATMSFVLRAEDLPNPRLPEDMADIVRRLYEHARRWAPGFEVPRAIPQVGWKLPLDGIGTADVAGLYRVDSEGFVSIEISPKFRGNDAALLAILAHEACHHILDLSGIRAATTEEYERLTELAGFICGFGLLTLKGYRQVEHVGLARRETHLGYLSPAEYEAAQHWVLKVQALSDPSTSSFGVNPTSRQRTEGLSLLRRICRWLSSPFFQASGRHGRGATTSSGRTSPLPIFDRTARRRKAALVRLGGDRKKLDRLLQYEKRRLPHAADADLLDAVMENLARDRR